MNCPKCNANLPDGTVFCPACGQNMGGAPYQAAPTYAPAYAAPKKETATGKIFKGIMGSWVTMLMFILACVWVGFELFDMINIFVNYKGSSIFFGLMGCLSDIAYKSFISILGLIVVGKIDNK